MARRSREDEEQRNGAGGAGAMPALSHAESPRRKRPATQPEATSTSTLRYVKHAVLILLILAALLVAGERVDAWLYGDARLQLRAEDPDAPFANIEVRGARLVDPIVIQQVFAEDLRASLYLVPLEERRRAIIDRVPWVKEASVARIWPNRLVVRIREREPVAFLAAPPEQKDGVRSVMLVEEDGYLLPPAPGVAMDLPVLLGVSAQDAVEFRRDQVRRMLRCLAALGDLAQGVSEVDLTNPHNLLLTYHKDGRVLLLILGNKNYRQRLERFLAYLPQIWARQPEARTFDLRDERGAIASAGGLHAR